MKIPYNYTPHRHKCEVKKEKTMTEEAVSKVIFAIKNGVKQTLVRHSQIRP
jgi:N-acetyl-gamma-glutamylphosphate reductase